MLTAVPTRFVVPIKVPEGRYLPDIDSASPPVAVEIRRPSPEGLRMTVLVQDRPEVCLRGLGRAQRSLHPDLHGCCIGGAHCLEIGESGLWVGVTGRGRGGWWRS